jgi:hypothetical protein
MDLDHPYLDLLKRALNNFLYLGGSRSFRDFEITQFYDNDKAQWRLPPYAQPHSLLATAKLNCLQSLMYDVVANNVAGDFIEAGVYKGGTTVFMRGFLRHHRISDRIVWVADSFMGIPKSTRYQDIGDPVDEWKDRWIAGLDEVKSIFSRYGLLDEQVKFLQGYFSESFPKAPFDKFAIARLDADSYESTMDALEYIYPRMTRGGYVIIDDWHLRKCVEAVHDYRRKQKIEEPIHTVANPIRVELVMEAFWRVDKPLEVVR